MLKNEFLELTGLKEIDDKEYRKIESVYNETDDDKSDFCKAWVEGDADKLKGYLVELASKVTNNRNDAAFWNNRAKTLARKVVLNEDSESTQIAYSTLGGAEAVKLKIEQNVELNDQDYSIILEVIDEYKMNHQ